MVKYDKLVRDRIPEIIRNSGKVPITYIANSEEYYRRLEEKLAEEVKELCAASNPDDREQELADVLEVLYAISEYNGTDPELLEELRRKKAKERGAFKERIVLKEVI